MSRATGEGKIRPLETSRQGCPTAFLLYNFDIGGCGLKTLHKRLLDRLIKILGRNPEHRIRLVGRASRSGSDSVNMQWSRRRVEAVARFLKEARVPDDQIRTEFIGESAPLSADLESEEDRSVEVHLQIARVLTLVLVDAHRARPTWALVEHIREAIAPLANRAGRELRIVQQRILERSGELSLTFEPGGRGNKPCGGLSILGDEAGESVYVGAHEELRVCGESQGDPRDPMNWEDPHGPRHLEHVSQLEHVFENGEPEFARFVANTAVHELGHIMAKLEHTEDRTNFMFDQGGSANLPRELRTRESMRRYWSSRLTFNSDQERRLVCAIQTGNFSGGLEMVRKK
jgi:hypothetical protein